MKALFIGGTGVISMNITRQLLAAGETVYLLNRGNRNHGLSGDVHFIQADINNDPEEKILQAIDEALQGEIPDVAADFIVFTKEQAERDVRLVKGRCRQYITFSSASAYEKPVRNYLIDESTPVSNPFWQYSRDKIEVEKYLADQYRQEGFPVTVIRPSHTYDEYKVPVCMHGNGGHYPVMKRMLEGKPVIIPGDGTTLWTVTHSRDFAKGFIGLMGNVHAIGQTVQITSDESVTWNQIYQVIADELGVPFRPYYVSTKFLTEIDPGYGWEGALTGDKCNTVVFDNSKIKKLVPGFTCTTRMDQGIREAVRNVMADPALQKEEPDFDAWCDRVIEVLEDAKSKLMPGR